ncbi:MAG TPA: cyclodeaminase/cyclohydrolase family protein [Acholeplasmataceae bacterium]|jgi:formiminotetrahydrofolate cyclodeaminase|nr:cyclodeaminase/cyclohydrolase family protein [Acholeplasmataceae bacterium]
MNFFELKVNEFLDKVDSAAPTPGGGSVSAQTIAFGIGLIRMVAQITITKKKFQALPDDIKSDYTNRFLKLEGLKQEAITLVDLDSAAFNKILNAYRMAKTTDEEIAKRKEKIRLATIEATNVPLKTAKLAYEALVVAEPMLEHATKTALSDFGVGTLLLIAGLEGAIMNVKTNLSGFADEEFKTACLKECSELLSNAKAIKNRVVTSVLNELEK